MDDRNGAVRRPRQDARHVSRTDVLLFPELVRSIGRPDTSLDLVSPYFVPGDDGTAALEALASAASRCAF